MDISLLHKPTLVEKLMLSHEVSGRGWLWKGHAKQTKTTLKGSFCDWRCDADVLNNQSCNTHDYSIKKPHSTCSECKTYSVHPRVLVSHSIVVFLKFWNPVSWLLQNSSQTKDFTMRQWTFCYSTPQTSSAQPQLSPDNQAHSNHRHCGAAPTQHWQLQQGSPLTTLTCEDEEKWADVKRWSSCGPHGILSSRDMWDLWQAGREWGMKEGGEEWKRSRWRRRRRREMWLVVVTTFAREIRGASFSSQAPPMWHQEEEGSTWQRVRSSALPWGWGFTPSQRNWATRM